MTPGLSPNTGKRRRLTLEGEHYYLIVTVGPDGPAVDITCPRENAPENVRMCRIVESITAGINEIFAEIGGANAA